MAGTFTHITLVDMLCQTGTESDDVAPGDDERSRQIRHALNAYSNFCELGAVSPDYPLLTPKHHNAAGWANVMHYCRTAEWIRDGIRLLTPKDFEVPETQRCIAWLYGYAAHVVADITVHPIVEAKVGPYNDDTKLNHRTCEMNQDVYAFRMNRHADIAAAEYLRNRGIGTCCRDVNKSRDLHPAIAEFWARILQTVPRDGLKMAPEHPRPESDPDPCEWHGWFVTIIDRFADEGRWLPYFARHGADRVGITYPEYNPDRPDFQSYVNGLRTPQGQPIAYDDVFAKARENVKAAWIQISEALICDDPEKFVLADANLDTGKALGTNTSIYWGDGQ